MKVNLKNLATTGFAAFIVTAFTPMVVLASDHNSTNNDATADAEMPADSDLDMTQDANDPDVSDTELDTVDQDETDQNELNSEELADERQDALKTLEDAAAMLSDMKSEDTGEDVPSKMREAKAVFLIPNFTRAALVVGGAGAEGVLLVRQEGGMGSQSGSTQSKTKIASAGDSGQAASASNSTSSKEWSNPVFYDMGAINAGLEAGVEIGQVAMLLMTEDAVDQFKQDSNFSLTADAGFSIVDYSERAQASVGKGDVVIWSDTQGAFAGLAVAVDGIVFDEEENQAFYGQRVEPEQIIEGDVQAQVENPLEEAMP